jgi:hypothetical protein
MIWTWCLSGQVPWCASWFFEKLVIPVLVAVAVYTLAVRQLKKKRAIDFAEKQLAEFYAPMLGLRTQIMSHAAFDRHMHTAASREVDARNALTHASLPKERMDDEEFQSYLSWVKDRMVNERVTTYIRMRDLFAEKMAYADPDTREWYEYFYSFVEMWRLLRENDTHGRSLFPSGVSGKLWTMFSEDGLEPFYDHLRDRVHFLQVEIAGGRPQKTGAPKPPPI